MADVVSVFQLGSSTVVTLPKKLGFKPGQKLKIRKFKKEVILEAEEVSPADKILKLAGGMDFKKAFGKSPSPEELDKIYEESY